MKHATRLILILLANSIFVAAASAQEKPFERFENAVRTERGGFAGNKQELSKVFNSERIRLGEQFDAELGKYLGSDVEKLYWIGFFLSSPSYLHGNTRLPESTYKIWAAAILLLKAKNNDSSFGKLVTIKRHLALVAKDLGRRAEALQLKNSAEKLQSSHSGLGSFVSGFSAVDNCRYIKLDEDEPFCGDEKPYEKIISAGILNYRTISQPKPAYPDEVRRKNIGGRVEVKVLIDFDGNPISAEAISGPEELREVSRQAALAAKFSPTKLSGSPVKVSGILIYTFSPK